jgi:hypothetical protein
MLGKMTKCDGWQQAEQKFCICVKTVYFEGEKKWL